MKSNNCNALSPARQSLTRLPRPIGQGDELVGSVSVARVRPRTSKGITASYGPRVTTQPLGPHHQPRPTGRRLRLPRALVCRTSSRGLGFPRVKHVPQAPAFRCPPHCARCNGWTLLQLATELARALCGPTASPVPGGVAHATAPKRRLPRPTEEGIFNGGKGIGLAGNRFNRPVISPRTHGQPVIASNFHRLEPTVPLRSLRPAKASRAI